MGDLPDYVGAWGIPSFEQLPEAYQQIKQGHYFYMFIESRDGDNFQGRVEDVFGHSRITGSFTDDVIDFTKSYPREAVQNGAYSGLLYYMGRREVQETKGKEREFFAGIITSSDNFPPKNFIMKTFDKEAHMTHFPFG